MRDLVEIDGSQGEGGGQILRTSVSLCCIFGRPLRITNIRAGRREPGLRPQHLEAVRASAEICNARLEGAEVGSTYLEMTPGEPPRSVSKRIETRTAASVTLIAQTLVPIAIFRKIDLNVEIRGGTEVPFSPTVDYLERVVVPIYNLMGADVSIELNRRGYYPKGGGSISLRLKGQGSSPKPIELNRRKVEQEDTPVHVLSVSRELPKHISQRQRDAAREFLERSGIREVETELDSDGSSLSPGSSVLVYSASPSAESFVGSDSLGARGKRAEEVGSEAAQDYFLQSTKTPNVDEHLADMMVTLLSCISGRSYFTTGRLSRHLETNLAVAQAVAGADFETRELGEGIYEVKLYGKGENPI